MNCLVISDIFPNRADPNRGPYNSQQVAELAKLCQVTVVNPFPWTTLLGAPRLLGAVRSGSDGILPDVPVRHPIQWYLPVLGRATYGQTLARCVRRACRRMSPARWDVIYATWAHPHGHAAMELAREWNVPFAVKVRGTDVNVLTVDLPRRARTEKVMRAADAVVAVSRPLAQSVEALGAPPPRIHLLHNGINAERFLPMPQEEARRRLGLEARARWIVFVGNLVPVKGLDVLLEAVAARRDDSLRVALVGSGPLRNSLAAQAERLGLGGRVLLAGGRPHDEIPVWLNAADVVCLSSRNEGCPNVVIEAMACGRPVVATRVGAVPDLLTDQSGVIVEPESAGALSDGLRQALARTWDAEAIRRAALAMDWASNARALHGILTHIVDERRRMTQV